MEVTDRIVKLKGYWVNDSSDLLVFIGPANGDEYHLHYGKVDDESLKVEKVGISFSQPKDKHARLLGSTRFKSKDIWVIEEDKIQIDSEIFHKLDSNGVGHHKIIF